MRLKVILPKLAVSLILLCSLPPFASAAIYQDSQYDKAMDLIQRGQFDSAIALLQQILDRSPADLKSRNLLGIALSGAGRGAEANEQFKKVLEQAPDFVPALKNLGINELRLGHSRDSALHLEQALRLAPGDPACHWGLAEIAFGEHRFKDAADHYEQSGAVASKDPGVLLRFATSYAEIKQPAKAIAMIDKLQSDADPKIQFQAGLILARVEKYDEAKRRFELARPAYPDPYAVAYNLMLVSIKLADFSAAIQIGRDLLAAGHSKAELYNLLGRAYAGAGKMNEAYESLRMATGLEPLDEGSYLDLIGLCLENRLYDRGLEIADVGIRLIPGSDRLHVDRGVALVMKDQVAEAEKEFRTARNLNPQGLGGAAMGLVLLQADKVQEAVTELREQSARSSNDPLIFWLLGEALYRSGPPPGSALEAEVIGALDRSISLDETLAQPRALLGKILFRRGEVGRAREELEQALKLDPGDVSTAYLLAQVYQKAGDSQRARELFTRVEKAKRSDLETTQRNLMRIIKPQSQ